MSQDRYEALQGSRLAAELDESQCRKLAGLMELVELKDGDVLVREGMAVYWRATRYGIDVGSSGVWRIHPMLELVGGVSLPVLLTVNRPATHWVVMPTLGGDALFEPWSFLALGGGAAVRYRAGSSPGFESLDPRATLRFYAGPALLDLAAAAPVFGADRTDLLLSASLGWIGF